MGHCRICFSHSLLERSQVEGQAPGLADLYLEKRNGGGWVGQAADPVSWEPVSTFQGWVSEAFSIVGNPAFRTRISLHFLFCAISTLTCLVCCWVSKMWKGVSALYPRDLCTESCPCQDIHVTISALSSRGDMKGALCAASRSMANWLLFPLIKCTVYLIFHSISKPLKPRGLS